jgi:GNAT superfamily N-acetyltransferase
MGKLAVEIRPVVDADYANWRVLWDGYNAFYERRGPTEVPERVTQTTWRRFLDPAEPMHALVADDGGALVGLVHYIFHRNTTLNDTTCYLQDLFTAPAARGKGVGRALIEAVYDAARKAGSGRVYWHTQTTNATARALYDQVAAHTGFIMYRKDI